MSQYDLVSEKTTVKPRAQVSLDLSSNVPSVETTPASPATESISAEPVAQGDSDMDHALHFVKSVGGLTKAKLVLAELEAILVGRG